MGGEITMTKIKNIIAAILFIAGFGILLYEPVQGFILQKQIENNMANVEIVPLDELEQTAEEQELLKTVLNISDDAVKQASEHAESIEEEVVVTDDTTPIDTYWDMDDRGITVGRMTIPEIGMDLPILKGVGNVEGRDNMSFGAVTNKLGQEMGKRNYVVSSHMTTQDHLLFTRLPKAQKGMTVYLTDTKNIYVYEVKHTKTVSPSEVSILDDVAGKKLVTLYTCINAYQDRFVVIGELVEVLDFNQHADIMN